MIYGNTAMTYVVTSKVTLTDRKPFVKCWFPHTDNPCLHTCQGMPHLPDIAWSTNSNTLQSLVRNGMVKIATT